MPRKSGPFSKKKHDPLFDSKDFKSLAKEEKIIVRELAETLHQNELSKPKEECPLLTLINVCKENYALFPDQRQKMDAELDRLQWDIMDTESNDSSFIYILDIELYVIYFIEYIDNYNNLYYNYMARRNTFFSDYPRVIEHICRFIKYFLNWMDYQSRLTLSNILYQYICYCHSNNSIIPSDVFHHFIQLENSLIKNYSNPANKGLPEFDRLPPKKSDELCHVQQLKAYLFFYTQNPEYFKKNANEDVHQKNLTTYILPCYRLLKKVNTYTSQFDTQLAWLILRFICETNQLPDDTYIHESLIFLTKDKGPVNPYIISYWSNILKNWALQENSNKPVEKKFFNLILKVHEKLIETDTPLNTAQLEVWLHFFLVVHRYQLPLEGAMQYKLNNYIMLYLKCLKSTTREFFDNNRELLHKSYITCLDVCRRLEPVLNHPSVDTDMMTPFIDGINELWMFFEVEHHLSQEINSHEIWIDIILKLMKTAQVFSLDILKNTLDSFSTESQIIYLEKLVKIADQNQLKFIIRHYSSILETQSELLCLYFKTMKDEFVDINLSDCLEEHSPIYQDWLSYQSLIISIDEYLNQVEDDILVSRSRLYCLMKEYLKLLKSDSNLSIQSRIQKFEIIIPIYEQMKLLKYEAETSGMLFKNYIHEFSELLNHSSKKELESFIEKVNAAVRNFQEQKPVNIHPISNQTAKNELPNASYERLLEINQGLVVQEIDDYFTKIKILKKLSMFDECIIWVKKFHLLFKTQKNNPVMLKILARCYKSIGRYDLSYKIYQKLLRQNTNPSKLMSLEFEMALCCIQWGTTDSINEAKNICEKLNTSQSHQLMNSEQLSHFAFTIAKGILKEGNSPLFFQTLEHFLNERHQKLIQIEVAWSQKDYLKVFDMTYASLLEKDDVLFLRNFLKSYKNDLSLSSEKVLNIKKIYSERYQTNPNPNLLMSLITIQEKLSQFEEALQNLKLLESISGKTTWGLIHLCIVNYQLKQYKEVLNLLQVIPNIELNYYLYFLLISTYAAMPVHQQKALEGFDYLISNSPSNDLYYFKALDFARKCHDEERIRKYQSKRDETLPSQFEVTEKSIERLEVSAFEKFQENVYENSTVEEEYSLTIANTF